jgi:hypothetical protein
MFKGLMLCDICELYVFPECKLCCNGKIKLCVLTVSLFYV